MSKNGPCKTYYGCFFNYIFKLSRNNRDLYQFEGTSVKLVPDLDLHKQYYRKTARINTLYFAVAQKSYLPVTISAYINQVFKII